MRRLLIFILDSLIARAAWQYVRLNPVSDPASPRRDASRNRRTRQRRSSTWSICGLQGSGHWAALGEASGELAAEFVTDDQ